MTIKELKKAIARMKDDDSVGVELAGLVYYTNGAKPKYVTKIGSIDDRKKIDNERELVIQLVMPFRSCYCEDEYLIKD